MLDYKKCESATERHHRSEFSCGTGPLHSAAMKFSLIVAAVVLALAQGSLAQDATTELEKLGRYFEEMKDKMTQELTEFVRNQDVGGQAQNLQSQMEPMVAQIQEQLRTITTNVEERVKPMAASVQAQIEPMVTEFQKQLETIFQRLTEQARAIGN